MRREPHLGLGLYIVRLIAEFHGGRADARNRPDGTGVVVTVTLPLALNRSPHSHRKTGLLLQIPRHRCLLFASSRSTRCDFESEATMNKRKIHSTTAVLATGMIIAGTSLAQMAPAPGAAPSAPAPAATPAMPHPEFAARRAARRPTAGTDYQSRAADGRFTGVPMGASPVPPMGNSPVPPMDSNSVTPLQDPMGRQAATTQSATSNRVPARTDSASAAFRMLDPSNRGYVTRWMQPDFPGFTTFDAADTNHDGRLSADEFANAWKSYSAQ